MEQKDAFGALAFLFLAIQIMGIVRNYSSDYMNFFWFCDFVPLLFAFAFLTHNVHLAKGLINIGLIPQVIFIILFIYNIVTDSPILLVIPESTTLFYDVSSIILHLSTLLALCFTYKTKPSKETVMYSLLVLIVMYISILGFTTSDQYVNYVYSAKTLVSFSIPYYTAFWIPLVLAVVVLPTHIIQNNIYNWYKRAHPSTDHVKDVIKSK